MSNDPSIEAVQQQRDCDTRDSDEIVDGMRASEHAILLLKNQKWQRIREVAQNSRLLATITAPYISNPKINDALRRFHRLIDRADLMVDLGHCSRVDLILQQANSALVELRGELMTIAGPLAGNYFQFIDHWNDRAGSAE